MKPLLVASRACALLLFVAAGTVSEAASDETERWYDLLRNGKKSGYFRVVWSPSTWEGRKTVHDTTEMVTRESRDMAGMHDRFEVRHTIDLERAPDGRLWSHRERTEEGSRVIRDEIVWTGSGYRRTHRLNGRTLVFEIKTDQPVATDAESFVGALLRAGKIEKGQVIEMRSLNVPARTIDIQKIHVLGETSWWPEGATEATPCWLFREVHEKSGAETRLWLDKDGALVRLIGEGGIEIRRTTAERARKMPVRPAEYSITVPASPQLERVFAADRLDVDIHLQGDPDRKLPDFPKSPWSQVKSVEGSDKEGWVMRVEMRSYPGTGVSTRLPIAPKGHERALEATGLMEVDDPRLKATAASIIGDETDARKAAHKLARFVYASLQKRSPDVAQASALAILEHRQGDCSEHALLFVALCRAAGIPARQCSGFVCIGTMWGSHAWAEIFVGEWVGADPTTGEVGTGARYLFFGYADSPDSFPGVVSSRAVGRMRILTRVVHEGEARFDLSDRNRHALELPGRVLSVLAGIEAEEIPDDWDVRAQWPNRMSLEGPGLRAQITAIADQGARMDTRGPKMTRAVETTFAGAPALRYATYRGTAYEVFSRKRVVRVIVREGGAREIAQLEKVLAPTFFPVARAWSARKEPAKAPIDQE